MSIRSMFPRVWRSFLIIGLVVSLVAVTPYAAPSQAAPNAAQTGPQSPQPTELHLTKAQTFTGDLRDLPQTKPSKAERAKLPEPPFAPTLYGTSGTAPQLAVPIVPHPPAPAPLMNFAGLDFANWGAGHPPDTNGDVGPTYYIETINTSIGIFSKTTGSLVTAFTFNTFMSQGNFGNLCDTNNFGDPIVLYDTFEDRWIITDFAFQLDGSGNVINPPGSFQCFAASKTGDPVSGGWNFYSIHPTGGLNDYAKFGIWPDGLYMSANMFGYSSGAAYIGPRVWAINKAQMYAGAPTVQVVSFDGPVADFTLLPSNARLQAGTPPAGTPNYFVSTWQFLNALTVYKFHVDWDRVSLSTFTGPSTPLASTSWPNAAVPNAPSQSGNSLDVLQIRAMMQNQYSNIGGIESLWATHTVRRADTSGFAAPRWYQVNVTGGTVAANLPQAATWDPDGANVMFRFMPSLAVDRMGNLALGYSTSSASTKPAIKYAGRLATDPINTFSQSEQLLYQGAGTQVGTCGGSTCTRWGDYSAMTLDPDGCTFWYTNMYYDVDGLNHQTRIGSFRYAECTPLDGGGTVQGTVTRASDNAPLSGATVALGTRITTTNASGVYQFTNVPSGTYPSLTASYPGYTTSSVSAIVVTDGLTTTQDFSLSAAPTSNCLIDTTQADFQLGVATSCDLTGSPGNVTLLNAPTIDQSYTDGTTTGTGFNTPGWAGQTFIPAVTGQLVQADVQLFCSGCSGTTPNLTLSIRATSGGLPTGSDLATATIVGFSSGAGVWYTANFGAPTTFTAGTQYALILRPVSNPSAGGYFWIRALPGAYANGQRVTTADSGSTWAADSTRDFNFRTYMQAGYASTGNLVSGLKDANPISGTTVNWTTLSWTASINVSTTVKFQAAASNNPTGPFTFVGPNGTAATYFTTTGASLAQFNGLRYLKYTAYLSTTNSAMTPVLNDVTVCFTNVQSYTLTTATTGSGSGTIGLNPPGGVYAQGTVVTLTATPDISSTFIGWSGDLSGSASPIAITMDANKFITATFDSIAASATITLSNLSQTYDGTPKPVTATTNPPSLTVVITYTGVSGTVYGSSTTAPTNAGTYSVTAVVSDTLYQGSAAGTLFVLPATTTLALASAPNPSAVGQSVTFTATVSVNPPGAGTPTGMLTLTIDSTPITQTLSVSGVTTYVTNTLAMGVHPVTANYSGDANFTGSSQTLSGGQVVTDTSITGLSAVSSSPTRLTDVTFFTATISTGVNVTYQWDFGDGHPGTGATVTHTYAAVGIYTAVVTATNGISTVNASLAVTVTNQTPIANAGTDQNVNVNAGVTLDGSSSSDPDGHLPLAYFWQQTGGPAVVLSSAVISRPTFTAPSAPTVLTFTLIVTDAVGAGSPSDSVVVHVTDQALAGLTAANDSPTSFGGTTHFTATISAGSNVQYMWDFGDGQTASGAQASHQYAHIGVYTATVTATNSLGSLQAMTTVTVVGFKVYLPLVANQYAATARHSNVNPVATDVNRPNVSSKVITAQ